VINVPVRYRCRKCGSVLYEFKGVGQSYAGLLSPIEVAKMYGYICPHCKSTLEASQVSIRENIAVKPVVGREDKLTPIVRTIVKTNLGLMEEAP
jgi:DNA-directed RNA polymerase subunit RPC12/RpoP